MRLEKGHSGPILSCSFSPSGRLLASASKDRTVSLWDYTGDCSNTLVLKGHKNAVLRVAFLKGGDGSGEELLATASADTTCALWDAPTGSRIRTFTGHTRIVNDVCAGGGDPHALLSASDDGSLTLWDSRTRTPALYIPGSYPLLACSFGSLPTTLLGAGIEGVIHAYDTRALPSGGSGGGGDIPSTPPPLFTLTGHLDAVSSLALSPTEDALLSLSFDGTARLWDVQPFSTHGEGRVKGCLAASPTTFEGGLVRGGWSPNGERVCGGGGDRLARVWDVDSGQVLALLGGHTGVCVEAAFHPKENVLATAGDTSIWLGEMRY